MFDEKPDTHGRLPGRRVERTRATYSQTELAAHEAWAHFTLDAPPAAALVHMLVRLAGDDDTVVASQRVLAERLGVSQATIARAVSKAAAANFIEVVRLGATGTGACAYRLNSRVHWTRSSDGKAGAAFRAVVLASGADQAKIETTPLRRVPVIRPDERAVLSGPGLPPPSQPQLDGFPPPGVEVDQL
ncbi:helix-turn-helix domain-containing protein [Frigidibacter sp.]|uniref:helix-turn-helix domain-containing protein n=1 Tax=Frigidibacter sp. TaxID=2586418 RepID=UPI002733615F|nr:helix-turn-helix domain-containing protein [Frigidibacter sp.]MDP3342822.1 helix-turn-helix domain-containing protein [Frigidibacter sp.]